MESTKNIRSIQVFLIVVGMALLIGGTVSIFITNYVESGLTFYLLVASIFVNSAWIIIFQYDRQKQKEAEKRAAAEVEKFEEPVSTQRKKKKKKRKKK